LFRIPFLPKPGYKIPKEMAKIFKKLKNVILAFYTSKPGSDRLRKWENNFLPEFCS